MRTFCGCWGHFKGWFWRFRDLLAFVRGVLGVFCWCWERFKGVLGAFGRWCWKRIIKQSLKDDAWILVKR